VGWSVDPDALQGLIAVVAGATRGAGRGIAAALGEAGATVICTGRSSVAGAGRSDYDRAETIEETAELVTRLGGTGISIQVDHLDSEQVQALAARLRADHGRIHVLVNDIWGGELIKGGPADWNIPISYVGEMMLDNFGISEQNWRDALEPDMVEGYPSAPAGFASSESPRYVGRAIAALASDPDRARWNQKSVSSAQLAREYGFTDIDGSQPGSWCFYQFDDDPRPLT
jgi:hypothetical protein